MYYNVTSVFLGVGVILVWVGLLRFFTYVKNYNVSFIVFFFSKILGGLEMLISISYGGYHFKGRDVCEGYHFEGTDGFTSMKYKPEGLEVRNVYKTLN